MSNNDTEEERSFRERYAQELQKKKKQPGTGSHSKIMRCLKKEEMWVRQQGKTPGRRGEQIKQQEIDKEIIRRNRLQQENEKNGN